MKQFLFFASPIATQELGKFIFYKTIFSIIFLIQCCFIFHSLKAGTNEIEVKESTRSLVAPEGESYRWYHNNVWLLGEEGKEIKVSKSGVYTVEVRTEGKFVSHHAAIIVTPFAIRKIYLIGDSTVANYSAGYYPQTGWGQMLPFFFNSTGVTIDNRAVGGTSAKSFYNNYWTGIRNSLQQGDYVFIQFGINDANKTDTARYTIPFTTFTQYLTKYVNEARAKGAIPVLITTVRRNAWNATTPPAVYDAYHDYPVATRQLANSSLNVPLIDLDVMSKSMMESAGSEYTTNYMYMNLASGEYPNYSSGKADNVHFQEMGAIEYAKLVVAGIRNLSSNTSVNPLIAQLVSTNQVNVASNIPSAGIITRTENYPSGIKVTLKARPKSGFTFQKWTDPAGSTVSTNLMFSFTMDATAKSYKAVYAGTSSPNITIQENTAGFCSVDGTIDNNNAGFTGAGFANTNNATAAGVKWKINVPSAGTYALAWTQSNGTPSTRPGRLLVNGTVVKANIEFPSTVNWTTWRETSVQVDLPAGASVIRLESTSSVGLGNIDFLRVTGNAATTATCNASSRTMDESLEANHASSIELFPNPSSTAFHIKAKGIFNYVIKDSSGRIKDKGEGSDELSVGNSLKPGVYFLEINNGTENRQIKLLKN